MFDALDTVALPEEAPKYVHGDFGYHNFIIQKAVLSVIDPTLMQNLILYELLFLYCSSPYDINDETLRAYYHYYSKYSWIDDKDFLIYARIIMAYGFQRVLDIIRKIQHNM